MHYLPILSTIITFIFAIAVFNRFNVRHGSHLLLWSIGLVLYGIGTLTEVSMLFKFNALALKLWYLSGAMLTAAWLGQGTINLLVRRRGITPTLNIILYRQPDGGGAGHHGTGHISRSILQPCPAAICPI